MGAHKKYNISLTGVQKEYLEKYIHISPEFRSTVLQGREQGNGGRLKGGDIRNMLKNSFDADCPLSGVCEPLKRCGLPWAGSPADRPCRTG